MLCEYNESAQCLNVGNKQSKTLNYQRTKHAIFDCTTISFTYFYDNLVNIDDDLMIVEAVVEIDRIKGRRNNRRKYHLMIVEIVVKSNVVFLFL